MALTTSGFRVQAQPGLQYLAPERMVGDPSNFLPALSQGAGTIQQLAAMREDAQLSPIRKQLQQVALERQQAELSAIPMQQQARKLELARLSRPIENVVDTGIEEVNRFPQIQSIGDDGQPITEQPAGTDVFATETVEVFDPVSGTTKRVARRTKPLLTMEQAQANAANLDFKNEVNDIKAQEAQARMLREQSMAETRQLRAQIAQEQATNPEWKVVGRGADANGNVVYTQVHPKSGEQRQIRTDLLPIQTVNAFDAMLSGLMGAKAGSGAPVAAQAAAAPVVDADIQELANAFGDGNNAVARPKSKAERDALPAGTEYVGPDGQKYIKR